MVALEPAGPHPRRCRGALRRSTDPPGGRARLPAMESRRLVPLGVAVAALVVLAGVASRGRPLAGSGGGGGPTASFFDYFFTTFLIFALIIVAVVVWGLLAVRPSKGTPRGRNHLVSYLISVAGGAAIALLLMHNAHFLQRFRQLDLNANKQHQTGSGARKFPPRVEQRARRPDPLGRDCDRRRAGRRSDLLHRRRPLEEADAPAVVAQQLPAGRVGRSRRVAGRSSERARPAAGDHRRVRADGGGAGRRRARAPTRRRRRSSIWSAR